MTRAMKLPKFQISVEPSSSVGSVYTWLVDPAKLGINLVPRFDRVGLVLKVFRGKVTDNPLEFRWGGRRGEGWDESPLADCTIVQNLLARKDLAPRVYGLVLLESPKRLYIAQVTERVTDGHGLGFSKEQRAEAEQLLAARGISGCFRAATKQDWVGGKFVDFQCCQLDRRAYTAFLVENCKRNAEWRGSMGMAYQGIPELGIRGRRNMVTRFADLEDKIDFAGKTVLDIGCNLGTCLREAQDRGAVRGFGIDRPNTAQAGFEVSNFLGYWNLDFGSIDRTEFCSIGRFDIVFFLSMDRVLRYSSDIADLVKEQLIVEAHPGQQRADLEQRLRADFSNVEFVGLSTDRQNRFLFLCTKETEE